MELRAAAINECRSKSGRVTPKSVVAHAKNPSSPLHSEFDWDINRAAQKEWERTASELIRSVKFIVEYEDREIVVPQWVSDPRIEESSYVSTQQVAERSGSASRDVLREELQRIKSAVHRAMALAAAFGLVSSFQRMLDEALRIESDLSGVDEGDDAR